MSLNRIPKHAKDEIMPWDQTIQLDIFEDVGFLDSPTLKDCQQLCTPIHEEPDQSEIYARQRVKFMLKQDKQQKRKNDILKHEKTPRKLMTKNPKLGESINKNYEVSTEINVYLNLLIILKSIHSSIELSNRPQLANANAKLMFPLLSIRNHDKSQSHNSIKYKFSKNSNLLGSFLSQQFY